MESTRELNVRVVLYADSGVGGGESGLETARLAIITSKAVCKSWNVFPDLLHPEGGRTSKGATLYRHKGEFAHKCVRTIDLQPQVAGCDPPLRVITTGGSLR